MGAILVKGYINLDKVKASGKIVTSKKGTKGLYIDCWVNDEEGNYGDNGGMYVSQTKEDREAGNTKDFMGNLTVTYVKDDFDATKAAVHKGKEEKATTGDDW